MKAPGFEMRMYAVRPLLLLTMLSACAGNDASGGATVSDSAGVQIVTSVSPVWKASEARRLPDAPDLVIGEDPGEPAEEFTQIKRVFTLPGGDIAVINQSRPPEIRVFDGQGRHERTIGGAGGGPGEFRYIFDAWLAPPDTIVTFDAGLARITYFSPSGEVLRSANFAQSGSGLSAIPWDRFADGTFIMRANRFVPENVTGAGRSTAPVLRMNENGELVDTIAVLPDLDYVTMPSGAPNLLRYGGFSTQVVEGDRYYRGLGDDFTIDVYDPTGRQLRSIRRPWEARPVTDEILERVRTIELDTVQPARREFLERDWAERPHAAHFPAYGSNWIVDREHALWVPGFNTGLDPVTDWSVFDAEGRWLGVVPMAAQFRPDEIGRDWVLGVWRDSLDVQSVRRYRFSGRSR